MKFSSTRFSELFKTAELAISGRPESTPGLSAEALCTSTDDLDLIFAHPEVNGSWVDLGSGYGQTVLHYKKTFPERQATGVEWERSRLEAAKLLARDEELECRFLEGDLLHTRIPEGDTYFLYFPQGHVLDRILHELSRVLNFRLVVVESHGDVFPRLEKETWLKCLAEIPLRSSRHHPMARVFAPASGPRELHGLHRYSFRDYSFLVRDSGGEWWGDSFGLVASGNDYLLAYPPRTVRGEDVVKIVTSEDLRAEVRFLSSLRRTGEITLHTRRKIITGPLRKIMETPAFSVEFPSGERVEWSEIHQIFKGPHLCFDSSSRSFSLPPAH